MTGIDENTTKSESVEKSVECRSCDTNIISEELDNA